MILQSLDQLYHRLKDEEDYNLPTPGYSVQKITFRIVLNPDGSLVDIQDARQTLTETTKSGKTKTKQVSPQILAPDLGGRSRNTKPFFLCDKLSYLTGYDKNSARKRLAQEHFEASKQFHLSFESQIETTEYKAICTFFKNFNANINLGQLSKIENFASIGLGVFLVLPSKKDAHEQQAILDFWSRCGSEIRSDSEPQITGQCLVRGNLEPIARLHEPKMKGFGQDSPLLVSFNDDAYKSFGKKQSYNSPVSEDAVFAYCNALNALLNGPQSHRHRITIGDVTTIFWTEQQSTSEALFSQLLEGKTEISAETETSENQTLHNQIQSLLNTLRRGGGSSLEELDDDPDTKFYILGLGKMNKSRLAVRFWHIGTIGQMLTRLADHYQNLALTCKKDRHPFYEPEFPPAQRLLDQTARERKAISPLLGGQLMQAILQGTPYPHTLLHGVLNRIRCVEKDSQGKTKERVTYLRAAILKAFLNRNILTKTTNQKMTEAIDPSRTEPAYHLGRLFAVYETAQKHAHDWKLERTIRETLYSAASATPLSVFGRIERLHHHHTAKKSHPTGSSKSYSDLVSEINQNFKGGTTPYPSTLNITDQAFFAVGYYHQLQHFRNLSEAKKEEDQKS